MTADTPPAHPAPGRRTILRESGLVVLVSIGASAIWSVISFLRSATAPGGIAAADATLNSSHAPGRPWLDLLVQLTGIALALAPVLLALHLLGAGAARRLGIDGCRPGRDLAAGAGLAAIIGLPGLGVYAAGRALGITAHVTPAALPDVWWAIPVLVLAAAQNAALEEIVGVGYLSTRWREAGWSWRTVIALAALGRGAYHLYQGLGAFVGNVLMGVVFAAWFARTGRALPLVIAHTLIDVVAFVGWALLAERLPGWLG